MREVGVSWDEVLAGARAECMCERLLDMSMGAHDHAGLIPWLEK